MPLDVPAYVTERLGPRLLVWGATLLQRGFE